MILDRYILDSLTAQVKALATALRMNAVGRLADIMRLSF